MHLWSKSGMRRESTITPGNNMFASHQPGVGHEPLGNEIRVLDNVAGVTDHAWDEHLAFRELDVLPHMPFVRVARVCCLKRIGPGVDAQDEIDDILQGCVIDAGAFIDAVARVEAYLLWRDAPESV